MTREPEDLTRYLDGELERDQLAPELAAKAEAFERLFQVLREEKVEASPRLREAVMTRVRAAAASPWRRSWTWIATPRPVRISPLTGALALAAAMALLLIARPQPSAEPPVAPAAAASGSKARFVFIAPGAKSVAVTGDFVNWSPEGIPMEDRQGTGVWVAEVELPPGVHHYVFIVNGSEMVTDPNATRVDDGFGQQNSVLLVPPRGSS
ncbi:1,4-alpha-glucan branching enzyme GlgB [bacterium HR33]|nr:1,4-alpha-glucan branching enzyme GlgB [bacterium HR33]